MIKLEIAARQALEALEMIATYSEEDKQCDNGYGAAWVANTAIAALRSALEQLNCQCGDKCFPIFSGDIEYCETCGKQTALAEQTERVTEGNGSEVSLETKAQKPVAWHHPQCEGQCIACLIEKAVQDAYGTQGRDYMLCHINAAPVSIQNESETDSSSSSMRTTVRTKDLTDEEIEAAVLSVNTTMEAWITYRAVIAADREKNR